MGGWIHTGLRGTFADDLNNCRGWDGSIGWVATSCMPTGAALSVLMFSTVGIGAFPSVSTPINPAWKHYAMCGTSTISTMNKALVAEGGSLIDRRHIIVMHGAFLGCHHVARWTWRSPGILELVIRVLCLVVYFLSTMQYGIRTQ
jgi:hypothetical protein